MVWTEERIELLKALWADGLTTGEIGKRLDVSKNAVVGKAHRLGLKARPSPIKRTRKQPKQAAPEKPAAPASPMAELTGPTCRWPFGDPKEPGFHFCGKPALPGKPYCGEHAAIAYVNSSSGGKAKQQEETAA